jgi:hypothetical protein
LEAGCILRLPDNILAEAKRLAAENGASLNQFLSSLIAERIGEMKAIAEIEARVARANPAASLEILRRAPDRPPLPGDDHLLVQS